MSFIVWLTTMTSSLISLRPLGLARILYSLKECDLTQWMATGAKAATNLIVERMTTDCTAALGLSMQLHGQHSPYQAAGDLSLTAGRELEEVVEEEWSKRRYTH